MKVLGINGSGRRDGNTAILIRTVFAELEQAGIETELVQLSDKTIKGCRGCYACHQARNRRCIHDDDDFNECITKMFQADGIILGSPVYTSDVSSQIKALLDRAAMVVYSEPGSMKHKVATAVIAVRRGGAMHAFDTLNHFFLSKEMLVVGSTYWNMGFGGREIGEVERDEEGMRNMRNLGQNMAWTLKQLAKAKD